MCLLYIMREEDLKKRDIAVEEFMREYLADNDNMPTVRVIAEHFGFRSWRTAHMTVRRLDKKGIIEFISGGRYRFTDRDTE